MPSIGPMELVIVLTLALLVLGPRRLPDAGRAMGRWRAGGCQRTATALACRVRPDIRAQVDTGHALAAR
jgi:Sec-independent protein translocase protein TatA